MFNLAESYPIYVNPVHAKKNNNHTASNVLKIYFKKSYRSPSKQQNMCRAILRGSDREVMLELLLLAACKL